MWRMPAFLLPLTRTVTYTRWLHLLVGALFAVVVGFVYPGLNGAHPHQWLLLPLVPVPLLALAALVPATRLAEGVQAQVMLLPGRHARHREADAGPAVAAAPSASWGDRGRTALWLVLRLEVGLLLAFGSVQLPGLTIALLTSAAGGDGGGSGPVPAVDGHHWWYALLAPLPLAVLAVCVVALGGLMTAAARRLLGPSPAERLAALEERTERLLEHNRLARELHDSIGHALTVAVVQAGAARAAGSPEFTDRALAAVEETGRHALEDLERVLRLLREDSGRRAADRPTLGDAGRLLESARASGAAVTCEVTGAAADVPGPVSREGYRIVQEALTNALRHGGPTVRITVRIAVSERQVELEVRNPVDSGASGREAATGQGGTAGRGLRGIRERAALLGGSARTGPCADGWRVRARLPFDHIG